MAEDFLNIHPKFRLNGRRYDAAGLIALAEAMRFEGDEEDNYLSEFLLNWLYPKPDMFVNTSGSTGKPQAIRLQKTHMINSAFATGKYFDLPEGTKALLCLSAKHIAGKMMLVRAMMLGWELDIVLPNKYALSHSAKVYDFSAMVPYQVYHSLAKLHRVKKLIIGGGAVTPALQQELQNSPIYAYATYGMTETVTHVAVKKLNNFKENSEAGVYYEALPGISFSQDSRNCLVIDAPEILEERLVTNDIVKLHSSTQFSWLGRYDNVINSGGLKIFPEQVESKLAPAIQSTFFIASVPAEPLGEEVVLIIEGDEKDLDESIFIGLEKYEIPKKVFFLPKFVYTDSGKILRVETLRLVSGLQ